MKGLVLRSLSGETEPYSLLLLVSSTTTGTGREILRRYSEGQNIFGLLPHLCTNRLHRGNFCTAEETGAVLFITKSSEEAEISKSSDGKLVSFSEKTQRKSDNIHLSGSGRRRALSYTSGSKLQPLCINYETRYKDLQAFGAKSCCAMSILSSWKGQSRARQVATRRKKKM